MGRRIFTLILGLTLVGVVTASAAMLSVDGGVLQVFANDVDLAPEPATIKITPQTLNPKSSNGQPSVTVKVEFANGLPSDCQPGGSNSAQMTAKGHSDPSVSSVPHPNNPNAWMITFTRDEVLSLLTEHPPGDVTLVVSGVINGCPFTGEDTIKYDQSQGQGQPGNGPQAMAPESIDSSLDENPNEETVEESQEATEAVKRTGPKESGADPALDETESLEGNGSVEDEGDDPKIEDQDTVKPPNDPVDEPVKTDPPAKEPGGPVDDETSTDAEKPGPQEDEPGTVKDDEQADPQEQGQEGEDTQVEQPPSDPPKVDPPLEQDAPDEDDTPVKQPVDEPPEVVDEDDTVAVPSTILPRQDEVVIGGRGDQPVDEPETPEPPVNEPEDVGDQGEAPVDEPEPVVDEPVVEPHEPVVDPPVQETPPEVVEEQPEEVESCLVDAELKVEPELLDIKAELDEVLLQVRYPGSMSRAARDLPSVEVRVKLGEDLYGDRKVDAVPDAEHPRTGEFELTLEQVIYLLDGKLGEVTLEVRGAVDECEFAGTDTLEVTATPEPVVVEPQEHEAVVDEPEQTAPVEDGVQQEQTESVEGDAVEQTGNTTGDPQVESEPVQDDAKDETVESTEPEGALEPDDDETGEPEGDE